MLKCCKTCSQEKKVQDFYFRSAHCKACDIKKSNQRYLKIKTEDNQMLKERNKTRQQIWKENNQQTYELYKKEAKHKYHLMSLNIKINKAIELLLSQGYQVIKG